MKKTMMCLGTMIVMLAAGLLTSSCKKSAETASTEAALKAAAEAMEQFDGLDGLLTGARKACGETCGDDDLEFVYFDVEEDDEGNEIPVAYFKSGEDIFQLMDIDGDGTFDVAVFDSNDDGEIDDDEIIDVESEGITVDDVSEMPLSTALDGYADDDADDADYADDEPESIVERTSRDAAPAAQRREEAIEADLPDYVNNARVKAMRKR